MLQFFRLRASVVRVQTTRMRCQQFGNPGLAASKRAGVLTRSGMHGR